MSAKLDPAQEAAAYTDAARVLVLAGAGAGKTRTLSARVTHLIRDRATAPERILLATFTRRAAREIKSRLVDTLGARAQALQAGTFHALAVRALRTHGAALGLPQDFSLLSRSGRKTLGAEALTSVGLDPRGAPGVDVSRFLDLLGRAENEECPLAEIFENLAPDLLPLASPLEAAAETYTDLKVRSGTLDYDDLLVLWRELLDPNHDVSRIITSSLDHVLIDEFQDTTPLQSELTEDLSAGGAQLFVVGDDAQSIYGFRGARFDNILDFPNRAPTEVHQLLRSYRSAPSVIALARATLAQDPLHFPKPLEAFAKSGPPVYRVQARDETDEAQWVARQSQALFQRGLSYESQAVLVRRHRDAPPLEWAFSQAGVPHHLRAGSRFAERPHVRAAIAHLQLVLHPLDWLAWREVLALRPGLGPVTTKSIVEQLQRVETEHATSARALLSPSIIRAAPQRTQAGLRSLAGLLGRLEPLSRPGQSGFFGRLLADPDSAAAACIARGGDEQEARRDLEALVEWEGESAELLEALSLGESPGPEAPQGVCVSTVHAAKGLEWEAVFVVGLEEGSFPTRAALGSRGGESEERRLFYVAITRAARHLFLSWAEGATRGFGAPSRFHEDVPAQLYRSIDTSTVVSA